MRRLLTIGVAYAALLFVAILGAQSVHFAAVESEGRKLLISEQDFESMIEWPHFSPAEIAWIGDSTLMPPWEYPSPVGKQLWPFSNWVAAMPGFDVFGHYFLFDAVLARQPRLIIEVANLRLVGAPEMRNAGALAALLPAGELWRALTLPLNTRGVTVPRLLLVRLLRYPWCLAQAQWFEGIARLFQDAPFWNVLGSKTADLVGRNMRDFVFQRHNQVRRFQADSRDAAPAIRMFGETARRAHARGIPMLVVVSPAPIHLMQAEGIYQPEVIIQRVQRIREVVEANGGTVLDLHDALGPADFRDRGGHCSEAGMNRMVALLVPTLRQLLGTPRPPR